MINFQVNMRGVQNQRISVEVQARSTKDAIEKAQQSVDETTEVDDVEVLSIVDDLDSYVYMEVANQEAERDRLPTVDEIVKAGFTTDEAKAGIRRYAEYHELPTPQI